MSAARMNLLALVRTAAVEDAEECAKFDTLVLVFYSFQEKIYFLKILSKIVSNSKYGIQIFQMNQHQFKERLRAQQNLFLLTNPLTTKNAMMGNENVCFFDNDGHFSTQKDFVYPGGSL